MEGTAFAAVNVAFRDRREVLNQLGVNVDLAPLEVVFYPSPSTYDGRFANNGWMQEAPDPMTKLTWDNAALVSPATAEKLDVETGDVIKINIGPGAAEAAVFVMPGQADGSIGLELGYGRRECGRVAKGAGHDVNPLREFGHMGFTTYAEVTKTGGKYSLVSAQEHHSMEGRPLVREATVEEFRHHPDFAKHAVHHPPLKSLYENPGAYG